MVDENGIDQKPVPIPVSGDLFDQYLKVQLLCDPKFKVTKVGTIPVLPKQPQVCTKKVHLRFGHRSDVMKKEFADSVTNIDQFNQFKLDPLFKQSVTRFYAKNRAQIDDWDTSEIVTQFEKYIEQYYSSSDPAYYVQKVQFIDFLLTCRTTDHQKEILNKRRQQLISTTFQELPSLDMETAQMIEKEFHIDSNALVSDIAQLIPSLSKQDVVDYADSRSSLAFAYTKDDFDAEEKWNAWYGKVNQLVAEITQQFASGKSNTRLVPPDIVAFVGMALNGSPKFFESFLKCTRVWLVDPFQLTLDFLEASDETDPDSVTRALHLAYLATPVQVEWEDWPSQKRTDFLSKTTVVFNQSKDLVHDMILHLFEDASALTAALDFVQQLHLDTDGLSGRTVVDDTVSSTFQSRFADHLKSTGLDQKRCNYDRIIALITLVIKDFGILLPWKASNSSLDSTFGIYVKAVQFLGQPAADYLNKFISESKSKGKSLASGDSTKLPTLLELAQSLDDVTGMKLNIQSLLFNDFLQVVTGWSKEISEKTTSAIEQDSNLERLPGCSYSASVQNVMGICNAYVKLLDSYKWKDKYQLALMYAQLYKGISESLVGYSEAVLARVNHSSEVYTPLNNVTKILEYFGEFENEQLVESSRLLSAGGSVETGRKIVSLCIIGADNVEDGKGNPVSLFVEVSGLVRGRTRFILDDYDPTWSEEFQTEVVNIHTGVLRFDIMQGEMSEYNSLPYTFDIDKAAAMPIEEKLSLQPRAGTLDITINVETEKNDPLFYLKRAKSEISKARDREIQQLVDTIAEPVKQIFSREHLEKSLKEAPVQKGSDYHNLKDAPVDNYINDMQLRIIDGLYDNLETGLFDEVIFQLWVRILRSAKNLLLPRISLIFHTIVSRLDKKMTTFTDLSLGWRYKKTTPSEMTRVDDWCWKLREMLNDPHKILQDPLDPVFEEFNKIPKLYSMHSVSLKEDYQEIWSVLSHEMPKRLAKSVKFDESGYETNSKHRETVLRVLLAKGETKFAKNSLEVEERYQRALRAELSRQYIIDTGVNP